MVATAECISAIAVHTFWSCDPVFHQPLWVSGFLRGPKRSKCVVWHACCFLRDQRDVR